jgi:cystathionine beta-lyase
MHVAEMDFEVSEQVRAVLTDLVQRSDMGYLGPIPELAPAFASFAERRWGWQPNTENLWLTTDVGVGVVELLRVLTEPGDRVGISTPVYSSFMKWIAEVQLEPADAPLVLLGNSWRLDLDAIEAQFRDGVRVYLLCNPQNPVGTVHTREELAALAELAVRYGVVVISDEIHAPLSYQGVEFTPYLSLGDAAIRTGILTTSTSKSYNFAGLKAAFIITESEALRAKLAGLPEAMHWRASLLGAFSMVASYQLADDWLDGTVAKLQSNRELLLSELASALPEVRAFEMSATYLAWLDVSAWGVDNAADWLLANAKVAVVPGPDHAPKSAKKYSGFIRLNFATEPELIQRAVASIAAAR